MYILIDFYNTLLKEYYFLCRWIKILDVTIKKGKGPTLGKLRTIQLIAADLQLLMHIFLDPKSEKYIEMDPRISKVNYSSRKNYSIESVILEKRLIFDSYLL